MAGILLGGSQRPGAAAPVRTTTGAAPGSSSSAPPAPVAGYVRRPAGRILVQDAVEAVGTGRVGEGRLAHAGAAPRSARGVAAAAAGSSFRRQGPARSSGAGTGRAEPLGVRRPLGRHATGALHGARRVESTPCRELGGARYNVSCAECIQQADGWAKEQHTPDRLEKRHSRLATYDQLLRVAVSWLHVATTAAAWG